MATRFNALDAFRGLCALSVVVFHTHISSSFTELAFFRNSSYFVEFFFVLSGFVLAHGYGMREDLTFKPYIIARFFRIYPLHIAMLIVFILLEGGKLSAYELLGFQFNKIPFTNDTAPSEIIPNLLLIQSWTDRWQSLSFNYPSWSISVEFYLYILLFGTTLLSLKTRKVAWGLISGGTVILILSEIEILTNPAQRGLFCFFAGAVTYKTFTTFASIRLNPIVANALELITIAAVVWLVQENFEHKDLILPLVFCITVLIFALEKTFWISSRSSISNGTSSITPSSIDHPQFLQ